MLLQDNGVKIVDPLGDMLEAAWEGYTDRLINVANTHEELLAQVKEMVENFHVDLAQPARVVVARDTRFSSLPQSLFLSFFFPV